MIAAKKELTDMEKRAKEAIVKCKASKDFAIKMAWAVANFYKSKEFFAV